MKTNNILSVQRLAHLVWNDIQAHKKIMLIALACAAVFFLLFQGLPNYFLVLYIGGFVLTSHSFKTVHSRHQVLQGLLLPCSNLERLLAPWLSSAVLYPLALLLVYYLFSWINLFLLHASMTPLHLWLMIAQYVVLQSIVLLGAIAFKKYPLMKTALVMGCVLLATLIFVAIFERVACPQCTIAWLMAYPVLKLLFWCGLAPVCWVVTYLKLTEYELT